MGYIMGHKRLLLAAVAAIAMLAAGPPARVNAQPEPRAVRLSRSTTMRSAAW